MPPARVDGEGSRRDVGSESEGLIAIHADDDAEDALVDWFSHFEDLKILLAEKPSAGMRVTMGRCHPDDTLVVVYTPPHEPEIDQTLLFVI